MPSPSLCYDTLIYYVLYLPEVPWLLGGIDLAYLPYQLSTFWSELYFAWRECLM